MFTEFGACFNSEECYNEVTSACDAFDSQLSSWAYWQYKSFGDFTTTGGTAEGMFNDDGTPQALKVKAITRTYAYAYQGTPESSFFSSTSGAYTTTYLVEDSVTDNTEIYMNPEMWYPNGYKWTVFHAEGGKQMEGTKLALSNDGHDLIFSFFDILDYNTNRCTILITPTLQTAKGSVASSIPELSLDYNYVDTGNSGKCPIKVHYDAGVEHNIEAKLYDREGTLLKNFGKTYGSNGFDAVCSQLVDAKLSLWSMSTSWHTASEQIAHIDMNGLNGHEATFNVRNIAVILQ